MRAAELAVVGGGAAGMFAAAAAADRGMRCILLERKARLGTKVLMSGNGRCNFSRNLSAEQMARDIGGEAGRWAERALRAMPPRRIAAVLESMGLRTRRMRDGRLFPASGKAADVVHALGDFLRDAGVAQAVNCPVRGIRRLKGGGFEVEAEAFSVAAERVLVATGGASFPKTGSTGDGQAWARELGLETVPLRAGLAGLEAPGTVREGDIGMRWEDGAARVLDEGGREVFRAEGEVDGERWGWGGAAVYNCQRWAAKAGLERFAVEVVAGDRTVVLRNPKARPLKEAIVTLGGVSLSEVDPETMEAKKVPGLHFAGEVLDVDGPTGGYNLSLAFATGYGAVAGMGRGRQFQ